MELVTRQNAYHLPDGVVRSITIHSGGEDLGEWTLPHTRDLISQATRWRCEGFHGRPPESLEVLLHGEWQCGEKGEIRDLDAYEFSLSTTWAEWCEEARQAAAQMERDRQSWREERAREEGMLHGIDSYNDWMGY